MDHQQTHGCVVAQNAIIACASAPGRAGVAVLRVSGVSLQDLALKLARKQLCPRKATLCILHDETEQALDQVLLIYFPAPHSYTGEDVLEIQCHGGQVLVDMVLAQVLHAAQGVGLSLRLAHPGEFSERAFLNEKIDLVQAEAIADLINASSESAVRSASRSLQGVFSALVHTLLSDLTQLRVLVEASLDFPEEAIDFIHLEQAHTQLMALCESVSKTLKQAKQGALLQEGLRLVIAGQPNVGKSALLNILAGVELAIVTPVAGTTRDKIEQTIHIQGIPIHVTDTAGLRQTQDEVERIGVERAWEAINTADVVLFLHDLARLNTSDYQKEDIHIAAQLPPQLPILHVYNKADLLESKSSALRPLDSQTSEKQKNSQTISCKTRLGLESLRQAILATCGWEALPEGVFMARKRHLQALLQVQTHLQQAQAHLSSRNAALDLAAEELRLAQNALGAITGNFTSDDLLGAIFSSFCIGK